MTKLRKATATPEEWAAYTEYHRKWHRDHAEKANAQKREYFARPDVKERRRIYDALPENVARRKAYAQSEKKKEKAKIRYEERMKDPSFRTYRNAYGRKTRTGFSPELITALKESQGNRCAICSVSFESRRMVADHCHGAKKPRGLLCHHCNIIEGMLVHVGLDPVEFASRLVSYLKCPPAIAT